MDFTTALAAFAAISLVYLFIQVNFTYAYFGFGYGWSSNRKTDKVLNPIGKRIANTWANQAESAAYIVPALGVAAITGLEHNGAQTAALLIVIGRAAFGPLYYTGVPFLRIPAWALAFFSTVYLAYVPLTV